ncbi:MAG: ATP-dependent Clp protease adaptor ClpS, partial [Chryseobacterium sp.]|nr:ATP-dependent Clp protease adaptor ClpS [Chryseobacterium sp.]
MYFSPFNIKDYEQPKREYEEDVAVLEDPGLENKLVVYNDDVNTFDFVISCLVEI